MSERLLEFSIYVLTGLIFLILSWVFVRELLSRLRNNKTQLQHEKVLALFSKWRVAKGQQKTKLEKQLKAVSVSILEPIFFEHFEGIWMEVEKQAFQKLYEALGIQDELRRVLKESFDPLKRENAVLKMASVASVQDIPFILDAFHDPSETPQVKQCCVKAISDMAVGVMQEKGAVQNIGLFVQLLDIPHPDLRGKIAKMLASLNGRIQTLIPHLIELKSDAAKTGVLEVFSHWNRLEYAQFLYDYLDDINPDIRKNAVSILAKFQDEKDILLFIQRLKDPNLEVRIAALEALAPFQNQAAESSVLKLLTDPSQKVRSKVLIFMALHGKEEHFRKLVSKLGDVSFQEAFLLELQSHKSQEIEKVFEFIGLDVRIFLQKYGWEACDRFYEAYLESAKSSLDAKIRRRALSAIMVWERTHILEVLKEISESDPDHEVRAYAKSKLLEFHKKRGLHER